MIVELKPKNGLPVIQIEMKAVGVKKETGDLVIKSLFQQLKAPADLFSPYIVTIKE